MATFTITNTADSADDTSIGTPAGTSGNYQGTLREAINFANQNVLNPSNVTTISTQPGLVGQITLADNLPLVASSIDIDGGGLTLNGGSQYRGFLISGIAGDGVNAAPTTVKIANLDFADVTATGGAGSGGGGGGLGAGGAIFVGPAANVTLTNVGFASAGAVGGTGGTNVGGGGGGGLAGAGFTGGGGIFFEGGDSFNAGGGGITTSGGPSSAQMNGNGGAGLSGLGGGGGGGASFGPVAPGKGGGIGAQRGSYNGFGGSGGFGGGGGAGQLLSISEDGGGYGGFGGGGGGGGGGDGGFGGGGGGGGMFGSIGGFGGGGSGGAISGAPGGFAGGDAGEAGAGGGGGGGALGGAVFVATGGSLTIAGDSTETGSMVIGGAGGGNHATSGSDYGAGIFYEGGSATPATLVFGAGDQDYDSAITDLDGAPNGSTAANGFGGTGGVTGLAKIGGGTLTLSGADSYTGGTLVGGGSTVALASQNAAGTGAITFGPTPGFDSELTLQLGAQNVGGTFHNTLDEFGTGDDVLDLRGFAFNGVPAYTALNNTLTVTGGSGGSESEAFQLTNGSAIFMASNDGEGGTLIRAVCYCSGTNIRVVRNSREVEVAVEDLCVGDFAVTAAGVYRAIRWIGHRTIDPRRHCRPEEVMPVRIRAHALARNRPARDLRVSPGHAIAIDLLGEVLIPASALINGTSIVQESVGSVTYWHVELDSHDLLLAENQPSESYLEMGNRGFFADSDVMALRTLPDARVSTHAGFCRPYVDCGPQFEAVRGMLRKRQARARMIASGSPGRTRARS